MIWVIMTLLCMSASLTNPATGLSHLSAPRQGKHGRQSSVVSYKGKFYTHEGKQRKLSSAIVKPAPSSTTAYSYKGKFYLYEHPSLDALNFGKSRCLCHIPKVSEV